MKRRVNWLKKNKNPYCAVVFHVHAVSTFTSFLLWNCHFIAPACKTSWLNEESKHTVASKYWSLNSIPFLHHPFSTPKLHWLTFPRGIDGPRQGYHVSSTKNGSKLIMLEKIFTKSLSVCFCLFIDFLKEWNSPPSDKSECLMPDKSFF